jgi:hypothetical protein
VSAAIFAGFGFSLAVTSFIRATPRPEFLSRRCRGGQF